MIVGMGSIDSSTARSTVLTAPVGEQRRRQDTSIAVFRLGVAALLTLWIWLGAPELVGVLWAMLGYAGWSAAALLLVRARLLRTHEITVVLDVLAITAAIYAFGAHTTPMVLFYVPLVVVVALQGGRRLALLGLVSALVSLALVLVLEQAGLISEAPLAEHMVLQQGSAVGGLFTLFLTALALGATYLLIAVNLRRLEGQVRSVEQLRAEADEQTEHSANLQNKLEEVQRLESLGRLAGGVAHDFNNLLTGILGYARLMKEDLARDAPMQADVDEVIRAAGRASELTGQLLAFSRRQIIRVRLIDLNLVVDELQRLLERIIGEHIDVNYCPGPSPALINADPNQIEQIVINLAVNAKDAMPQGGQLTIETGPVVLDAAYCAENPEVEPGLYLMLAVSDNGEGMDDETRHRAFEPFFTTKEVGQGTGLGLATVYGIVKQHHGHVEVQSDPGSGTTFKIFFPMAEGEVEEPDQFVDTTPTGLETVLLAEDEAVVRKLVTRILGRFGYTVLEADSGETALDLASEHDGSIQLLLTDLMMPGMTGKELAERLRAESPEIKVLYMSGYPAEEIGRLGVLDDDFEFMAKPFSAEDLLTKVRRALDRPSRSAP